LQADGKQVNCGHHQREGRIGDALHRLAAGVEHEAFALAEIAGVVHRDHGIVPKHVDTLALVENARALDVVSAPGQVDADDDYQECKRCAGRHDLVAQYSTWRSVGNSDLEIG